VLDSEDDKFRVCQICSKACRAEKIKLGVCETCRTLGLGSAEKLQEGC